MGLDAVEILMEVEEVFEISIEDAVAEQMETPGDLIDAVMVKVAQASATGCLTQRAFNLLRKSLLRHLPLKRRDIAPSVSMARLAAKSDRPSLLERLAADLGTGPLPGLVRPSWLVALLTMLSLTGGAGAAIAAVLRWPGAEWGALFFLGATTAAVTAFAAWAASARWAKEFPTAMATVGDVARWVMAHKPDLATPHKAGWTREQVAARVREIVVEQLNCASVYREDASFVKDLGLS